MREIKFRAWHDGQMLYEDWSMNVFRTIGDILKFDTVMQYTGLKDANGVEIYEGDIVLTMHGVMAVEWNDDACLMQFDDGSPINGGEMYGTHKTIIGNIYENPELIADSGKEKGE